MDDSYISHAYKVFKRNNTSVHRLPPLQSAVLAVV